jgi:hypothetical protein
MIKIMKIIDIFIKMLNPRGEYNKRLFFRYFKTLKIMKNR